jgi:hypothetical protein
MKDGEDAPLRHADAAGREPLLELPVAPADDLGEEIEDMAFQLEIGRRCRALGQPAQCPSSHEALPLCSVDAGARATLA